VHQRTAAISPKIHNKAIVRISKETMETKIQIAKKGQARDCLLCVRNSDLWDAYFKANPSHESTLEEMISKKQVYVATNEKDNCIGFMGVINNGCFRKFSYLSILAVKKRYRNKGVGELLVNKFESIGFKRADIVFILVSDFNRKAQKFYRKLGYKKVGNIPNLFKLGVSENLLVKYKI
jgi:ribosomal protein S18 acetylase RimI-like enzyme